MSNLVELIIIVSVLTVTFLLSYTALHVFQILRELKITLRKINHLLDDPGIIDRFLRPPASPPADYSPSVARKSPPRFFRKSA